jgi:hypothetical protein
MAHLPFSHHRQRFSQANNLKSSGHVQCSSDNQAINTLSAGGALMRSAFMIRKATKVLAAN